MNTNDIWLIAGLGNPETKYDGTRHNAGYAALDYLADKWGISVSKTKFEGLWGQGEVDGHKVVLLKPLTYMNLSGDSIAPTAGFFKIPADHVIVLCDDITQNPGKLRIRPSGSAGGHNGLKSIIARLGGENFPRIRIGVVPNLKKDPTPIIPILENLKNDPARFVRLSVANNLNDIAKDNPEIVIDLAKKWKGESKEVDWIIKHGCRTLLKQGNPEVMELFGFDSIRNNISVEDFQISSPKVKVGDSLEFGFNLLNHSNKTIKIRLEYGIYYQKANGTLTKKVHKISEKEYTGNSTTRITRKHSFRVVTTRKFHLGLHQIAIIINGSEFEKYDFDLIE